MINFLLQPSKFIYSYFFPIAYSLSLVSVGAGSLFDIIILPLLFLFSLLSIVSGNFITKDLKNICLIYILSILFITFIKLLLPFPPNYSLITFLALSLRVTLPISIFISLAYFYKKFTQLSDINQIKIYKFMYILWLFFIVMTCIFSIINFKGRLGLSFPFYSSGNIDRQVFGPAMSFVAITSFTTAYFNFFKNKQIFIFNLFAMLLTFFCSLGSGSRGPILIFSIFILFCFPLKIRFEINKKIIFLTSILFVPITSVITYIFYVFPRIFDISIVRAFSFFEAILNPFSDDSRKDQISDFVNFFFQTYVWPIGDLDSPLLTPDSGPYFLLSNYGIIILALFILIFLLLIKIDKIKFTSVFLLATLFQFLISSETIFIPRYLILVAWSYLIMFLTFRLKDKIIHRKILR